MCKLIALWVCLAAALLTETMATYGDCPVDCPYQKTVKYENRSPFEVSMDPAPEGGEDPNTLFTGSGVTLISSGPVTITITAQDGQGFWPQAMRMQVANEEEYEVEYTLEDGTVIKRRVKKFSDVVKVGKAIEREENQLVVAVTVTAVPKESLNLEMSDLRMVVCLKDVAQLDVGMCPAEASKKRRVTHKKQDDFTFGDAQDALQKSGLFMESATPVQITIKLGGLEFMVLGFRIKVRNAASVTAMIGSDDNTNAVEVKRKGRVYSWKFIPAEMDIQMVTSLELSLTPKAGRVMQYKGLVLEACKQ